MAIASTTCGYYNPVGADGSTTTPFAGDFAFASSTCVTEYEGFSPFPDYVVTRDSGDIVFSLGVLIFIAAFLLCGFFFNTFTKRPK